MWVSSPVKGDLLGVGKLGREHPAIVYLVDDNAQRSDLITAVVAELGLDLAYVGDVAQLPLRATTDRPGCVILSDRALAHAEKARGQVVTDFQDITSGGRLNLVGRGLATIVLCEQPEIEKVVRFMRAGAVNVLPTPVDAHSLAHWIDEAIASDRQRLEQEERLELIRHAYNSLSERKRAVLQHMIDGRASKWSAHVLDVSRRTIELDRADIHRLFGANNAIELARLVTENKCLPLNFSPFPSLESSP